MFLAFHEIGRNYDTEHPDFGRMAKDFFCTIFMPVKSFYKGDTKIIRLADIKKIKARTFISSNGIHKGSIISKNSVLTEQWEAWETSEELAILLGDNVQSKQ